MKLINLLGKKYGRLTVVNKTGKRLCGSVVWVCMCDCGNIKEIASTSLISGSTKSCGCLRSEILDIQHKNIKTHGMWNSRPYKIFYGMLQRCENPKATRYKDYGGRGIKVCKRWHIFENFWEDMKDKYSDNLTLDRINNNNNYSKNNCRWVTNKEQHSNTRRNYFITYHGKKQTLSKWAEDLKTNHQTLQFRIKKGWSIKSVLTIPIKKYDIIKNTTN